MPAATSAQTPPTCAQLGADPAFGLAGNPVIIQHSTTLIPAVGTIPAYCRVDFVVSERGGPEAGYASGEIQRIGLRVGLPANSSDGGTGGEPEGQGAWNGRVRNLGVGGLAGAVSAVTLATNFRYVGSSTDGGHLGPTSDFGVIQATNELNLGKIDDFFVDSARLQYQWALRLANAYYLKPAVRNYWDGCSTGGAHGLMLASKYGGDFDGFLISAPLTNHTRTSSANAFRQWANKDLTAGTVTDPKVFTTIQRLTAACDGLDGIVDGLLNEPRLCTESAHVNVCGEPNAASPPNCLTPSEAEVIDLALDGPRNDLGTRVWFPSGRSAMISLSVPSNGQGTSGIFAWANSDLGFDWRTGPRTNWDDLVQLATSTLADHTETATPDQRAAKDRGAKILMWQGSADQTVPFQSNIYYYSKVLDFFGGASSVQPWFRFFLAPGVAHCGGGAGPQPQNLFNTLVGWAEGGPAPDSILSSGAGRTRPLCPFPQTAIYDGVGNPNVASSFVCGGDIQTKEAKCDGLIARLTHETEAGLEPLGGEDDISCGFASLPETTAALSPNAVAGWFRHPTATLTATDRDGDLDRTEYRLDSASDWTPYAGPFAIEGDGPHTLEYRSIDRLGHVEAVRSLSFKIDATAPVIAGLPAACEIWPPNRSMIEVATVTASDALSGLTPGTPSISVASNEILDEGDVETAGGIVRLRATRQGDGGGRTYDVRVEATDVAGNTATASARCVVPRDQGGT
jgi:hypothetical protein